MRPHRVLGTAGHIDHGKTSLVKALTGADAGQAGQAGQPGQPGRADRLDRLREEQERGITIELGFAHLTLPSGVPLAVVDVPGHERFIRTMVAGAVGIDAALLVVAADEGVMPQTREHLDICELLGVRAGVVALSKADLAPAELRELAVEELREALRGTFLADAPIVPVSARTGEGLAALTAALDAVLAGVPGRDEAGAARLPVDRVFTLRGFGTVVTGTLWSGRLRVGDELVPLPGLRGNQGAAPAKIRGLHVHGAPVETAVAGQRAAVNLALPLDTALRGQTLVPPGARVASRLVDVELRYLPVARAPLGRRSRLLFHAAAAQRLAGVTLLDREALRPGERALAQVQLDEPLALVPGDRFVLRGFAPQKNHGTTVGGGVVLRVQSQRHRHGTPALCRTLRDIAAALPARDARVLVQTEVARRGVAGALRSELAQVLPLSPAELREALRGLREGKRVLEPGETDPGAGGDALCVSAEAVQLVVAAIVDVVAAHHRAQPSAAGLPKEALRLQLGPRGGTRAAAAGVVGAGEGPPVLCPPRVLALALDQALRARRLVLERDRDRETLRLPTHDVRAATAGQRAAALAQRAAEVLLRGGLGPASPAELPGLLGLAEGEQPLLRQALESLVRDKTLVRTKDLLFHRAAVEELRGRLVAYLCAHRELTTAAWKDLVGQSRKYAIPLAEYFDAEKVTLRVGDLRRLRGAPPGLPGQAAAPAPESAAGSGSPATAERGVPGPAAAGGRVDSGRSDA